MRTTKKKTATLAQVLEYMDGPQAVLLNRGNISKIAGVAIEKGGYTHPFFGAEISLDQWERYRRGLMDFRSLFIIRVSKHGTYLTYRTKKTTKSS